MKILQEETIVKEKVHVDEKVDKGNKAQLVVYNDDFNTFDWVIKCFIDILQHSFIQSEQLAMMIHFNGKAIVKTGNFKKLNQWRRALSEKGLNAVIERLDK